MRQGEPVIEESRSVEDVHHLRLMALLYEMVREKGNRGAASELGTAPRTLASCMKAGRLSWRAREALERGLQSGAGSATGAQRCPGGPHRGVGGGSSETVSKRLGQVSSFDLPSADRLDARTHDLSNECCRIDHQA